MNKSCASCWANPKDVILKRRRIDFGEMCEPENRSILDMAADNIVHVLERSNTGSPGMQGTLRLMVITSKYSLLRAFGRP